MVIPAYKFDGRNMTTALYQPLVERVEKLPGVQAASLTTVVPLGKRFPILFTLAADEQGPDAARRADLTAQFRAVGPGLQRVFGFRMLKGRFFNEGDTPGSLPVVVVNRAFVKAYSGDDRDPGKILGEKLLSYGREKPAEIVGVLDDERQASVAGQSQPEIEVCIPQITPDSGFYRVAEGLAMNLAVRTERSPSSFVPELREVLRSSSPELAGSTFTTMDQVVEDSFGDQRMAARLLQVFGGSALLLCVAGLYGLLAYLVTQRTQELGVRLALGAQREQVIWLVMRQAWWILLTGSVIGLTVSFLSSRMLASFLYGVKTHDALTLGAASLLLLGIGLAAAYVPARRAARLDPMQALHTE
jgi:predicted permease